MKITDSDIIKNGEQELIDAITADLDWGAIEDIFLKEHNLGIDEDIEYKSGDIVAVDNRIAYKLEFEVKVNLSVLLDRNGDYLSVNIYNKKDIPGDDETAEPDNEIDEFGVSAEAEQAEDKIDINAVEDSISVQDDFSIDEEDNTDAVKETTAEVIEVPIERDESGSFKDLNDDDSDDMGNLVDDIVENIKKAG